MKIVDVICSEGKGGFFYDDQMAIRHGAKSDGAIYHGVPETHGFSAVRQSSEAISVMLILEDGQVSIGDCVAVQYSGSGGRDPLFEADRYIKFIEKYISPKLIGRELMSFKELAEEIDTMIDPDTGKLVHTAIRYGVTGAILDAVAKSKKVTMAEVISKEYNTAISDKIIPIYAQSGDERYVNVDKMIMKEIDVIPHGLINNVEEKLGTKGEKLLEFIDWIVSRIDVVNPSGEYKPNLHFDVYGTIGLAFGQDNYEEISDYFKKIEKHAKGLNVNIEFPIDGGDRDSTICYVKKLTELLEKEDIHVKIVNDEWCNTFEDIKLFIENKAGHIIHIKTPDLGGINNAIEAVKYCNENGFGAFLGGSCTETDISARISANIAMATSPIQMIAKPGMGVDEGYMICYNEMNRIFKLIKRE